ncbi:sigma-54-dependent transcriptional regulator [Hydrogenovibrio marinus]|uniref:Fis family transcriptional regulator n=1 Tax=Hydrogenovibrio marinus TaxID=28885 RepID=A0A066ZUA6_HYDMR|nr:sigma-54 dependent transcriptional regulator [Hydrogenovibrio marinus]KDN95859.1 Fis family transcriptional regulator [Hydrogenovibrio marinus]BBN58654.1 sigma-54-dependent Fis family transcriptional regulator [Hydrogenovibrio marinus]
MKPGKILIIDDEKDIRNLMEEIFTEEGYQVTTAANGQQAQKAWREQSADLVFLDIWMPDIDGITLLKQMIDEQVLENSCVVMMSGHGTIETAIEATRLGAYDFLEKPLSLAKLLITAERAMEHIQLHQENRHLKQKIPDQILPIGKSKVIAELRNTIKRLSKYTMPVLVVGESGTGKHRLAEAIHKISDRKDHKIVEINGADFDDQERLLVGEESNGHIFRGEFDRADGGTLIVSNFESLSSHGQDCLTQLIYDNSYSRLGSDRKIQLNVRVIVLTEVDPEELAKSRYIREDLINRLNVMPVYVPSLRQHTEDIPELIDYFVDFFLTTEGLNYREFDLSAKNVLRQYSWPGNFKELKNCIQRLLILGDGEVTDVEVKKLLESNKQDSSLPLATVDTSINLKQAKERFEAAYLSQMLRETGGNVTETAKLSGVERTNLYRKLKTLNIDPKNPK